MDKPNSESVLFPISSEKALRLMEGENKLIFVVSKKSTKAQIKQDVEKLFGVKVTKVNTYFTPSSIKKAIVKLDSSTPAMDVATKLGLM
ncbi:MAG TPA: 50S ribosomal protein L23 [Candidatus Woesearchaeota archaeon]|jgi:large subunit ribosomal protein L23|nr:50S ribosomal protein L23 [Candidatus Woesearchaeota archaeon]